MAQDITINQLNPITFEYQTYTPSDEKLIASSVLDTSFTASIDYIEYYVFDLNKTQIFPDTTTTELTKYDIREGDILLDPTSNLQSLAFNVGTYNIYYSFYRKRLASSINENYFISEISSDRTEIRLDSNTIANELIISSSNEFIQYRENAEYFVDFYLNFGLNQTIIANNLKLETEENLDPTVLIKLYEPLPDNFKVKDQLWVVELLSDPQLYQVNFPYEPTIENDFTYLQGPNYSLEVRQETATSGEQFSFNTLIKSDITSSINQIKSLLNEKEININVNYENYSNFVNFSSAQTRLENFAYKAALIESSSSQINTYLAQITSGTTSSIAYSASLATLNGEIDTVIKNFDGYDYWLYFNSGSDYSWPKQNTEPPFVLYGTGSTEALEWLGNSNLSSSYYGGQALSASNYDQDNRDWLYWSIPEYLRDDPQNQRYELFTDMVGQYYDNIWVYTKDLTNKFDADNRLDYGISKDLVADAIRDFSVKLYASSFNNDDLFTAFLGLTPSGSLFPFPTMTSSLSPPTGYEYVNNEISASTDVVPLNDTQKQLYKRVYHNIPYMLKKKGTIGGIRALITSYGIPDTILRISEFGGKDKNEAHDYDLKQDVFNYTFDTGFEATNFVSSSWSGLNSQWGPGTELVPQTCQFRFRTAGMPTASANVASSDIRYSQSLWNNSLNGVTGSLLVLEYTGSGLTSGSYSGSIPSIYDKYGTLKFIPDLTNENISASVYLPFFDGEWWSVQMNHTGSSTNTTGSLYSANQINGVIGFTGSNTIKGYDAVDWNDSLIANLNTSSNITTPAEVIYKPFSGSYQEYRFWNQNISQSNFYDYTANPYSDEGNGVNSTPDQLAFRAALGTELNTASRTSIHPRITGSLVQITQSWDDYSSFTISGSDDRLFRTNVEDIYQDQVPSGIKNRITNKIQVEDLILAEAPYGFTTPTSSTATISSTNNDTTTISPFDSIQQSSPLSQSYTPNVNYLEVGFSPSNQINDDINAQLGYFNIGEYIGDPRFVSSSSYTYPDLDLLRNAYFEKYIKSYDIVDFIRLIKFFDNSLFKMIKDFTPARTSLASGVIVKQHLLERNRQRPPNVTSSFHDYSGSIKSFPRDYNTGSWDFPQYSYTSGSSIYRFSGGPGGSFNKFNTLCNNPYYSLNHLIPGTELTIISGAAEIQDGTWVFEVDQTVGPSSSFTNVSQSIPGYAMDSGSVFYNKAYIEITAHSDQMQNVTIAQSASVAYRITATASNDTVSVGEFGAHDVYQGLGIELSSNGYNNRIVLTEKVMLQSGMVAELDFGNAVFEVPTNAVGSHDTCDITYFSGDSHPQRYNLTQSWSESVNNSVINSLLFNQSNSIWLSASYGGYDTFLHSDQSEFYNGIFSGSNLTVVTQSLNPQFYLNVADKNLQYRPIFYSFTPSIQGTLDSAQFAVLNNHPQPGDVWIASSQTSTTEDGNLPDSSGTNLVSRIRINKTDVNGIDVGDYIEVGTDLEFLFFAPGDPSTPTLLATTYRVTGILNYGESIILTIDSTQGNPNKAWDKYGGSENWSLSSNTRYSTSGSLGTEGTQPGTAPDFDQQGVFLNPTKASQAQSFFYYDRDNIDNQGFFNTGSSTQYRTQSVVDTWNRTGTYILDRIPNIPLFFSASTEVEATTIENVSSAITSSDSVLHESASYEGVGLIDQNFTISTSPPSDTKWIPAPKTVGPDLNPSFYNATYNTQIPGNMSGSEGEVGGHPKISVKGTASMDFYFPGIRISGSYPTLTPGTYNYYPLSGSSIDFAAANNQDFEGSFGGNFPTSWFWSGSTTPPSYDGALSFQFAALANDWMTNGGGTNYDPMNIGEVNFTVDYDITGSVDNFTASLFYADFSGPVADEGGPITGSWVIVFKNGHKAFNKRINQAGLSVTLPVATIGIDLDLDGGSPEQLGRYLRFEVKGPEDFDYEFRGLTISQFTTDIYWFQDFGAGDNYGTSSWNGGTAFNTTYYQPGTSNGLITNEATASQEDTPDSYPTCDVAALLKRTGSSELGIEYDYIITGSYRTGVDIAEGASIMFDTPPYESPILDIFNPDITGSGDTNTGSTINFNHDMYYIEYSMSNFSAGVLDESTVNSVDFNFLPTSDTGSQIIVRNSIDGGSTGFNFSGSFRVLKGNVLSDPDSYGTPIITQDFHMETKTTSKTIYVSGSYIGPYEYGDIFSIDLSVTKSFASGVVCSGQTDFAIFPSASRWAPFDSTYMSSGSSGPPAYGEYRVPTSTETILDTFFGVGLLPFNLYTDGQPLLNNYSANRENTWLMDVDYNNQSGPIIPINQGLILSGSALKAAVPDSNYTQLRSIIPRYLGSKSTSLLYNVYSYGDTGTYGQTPTIELRNAYFGYFNNIQNPYPNINGVIRLNLTNLIDEQGNAIPPSLTGLSNVIFKQVFPVNSQAAISINSGSKELKGLEGQSTISTIGSYPSPICYTQNTSDGYSSEIPLSGSGRISIYDNSGSAAAKNFYGVSAMGPGDDGVSTLPGKTFDTILMPSVAVEQASYSNVTSTVTAPYIPNQGVFLFTGSADTVRGEDLANPQRLTVETKFVTSFIYESGTDELNIKLSCISGSTNIPFILEDITMDAYYLGNKVSCGSMLGNIQGVDWREGVGVRFIGPREAAPGKKYNTALAGAGNVETKEFFLNRDNQMEALFENAAIGPMLINRGIAWKPKGGVDNGGPVDALEFTIKANTGDYMFKAYDEIKWKLEGKARDSKSSNVQTVFYPTSTPTDVENFSTNFTVQGAYDDADGDNTASAPYWVYSSSAIQSIIEMSSSNFNEAYGSAWYQGQIPYIPGPSQYFQGGSEPVGTRFDNVEYPLQIEVGDQIRFVNNENYTYDILKVTDPSENIVSNADLERVGRVKLTLDRDVPTSINMDFFVVRRPISNANSVYIYGDFPYANLITVTNSSSTEAVTSGILYPDFPTEYITISASSIVTDLISQGVIES